jgi:S-adenosylmethionine:diacylglycerol 3-amino-3-carboxypropyl transferase
MVSAATWRDCIALKGSGNRRLSTMVTRSVTTLIQPRLFNHKLAAHALKLACFRTFLMSRWITVVTLTLTLMMNAG